MDSLGPSEDDAAEFEKELAKMVTDNAESRKVDKKTALALWDQTVPPPVLRKKRAEDVEEGPTSGTSEDRAGVMKFTLFTKRGNKPQVPYLLP
jgi:regulator of nonsense transcripts 2